MGFFWQKKVLKHLELIILVKSITTAMEKREKKKKIQNQLQNTVSECKNNDNCSSQISAFSVLSLAVSHSPPLPR